MQTHSPSLRPAAAPMPLVPFVRASHEHVEPMADYTSAVLSASSQAAGPYSVNAYGYLKGLWVLVTAAGGTMGPGVLAGDAPWNVLTDVRLLDVNGSPIVGPNITGYDLYLINRFGAYQAADIPELFPDAVLTGANFTFALRVPVEIDHTDAYGAIANQNAAQAYQFSFTIAPNSTVFSTLPTTSPTVRVQVWAEAWSQPAAANMLGQPQQTMPPGHGTTQFWSAYVKTVAAGQQTILLPRVGNLIRNVIVSLYSTAVPTARTAVDFPDPVQIIWDSRILVNESAKYRRYLMQRRFGQYGYTLPTGVYAYDFTHDGGGPGSEARNLWLPTLGATRLEIVGSFGAAAQTVRVLTNDVAPAGS